MKNKTRHLLGLIWQCDFRASDGHSKMTCHMGSLCCILCYQWGSWQSPVKDSCSGMFLNGHYAIHIECSSSALSWAVIFSVEILVSFDLVTFGHCGLPSQDQVGYKENCLSSFSRAHSYKGICLCWVQILALLLDSKWPGQVSWHLWVSVLFPWIMIIIISIALEHLSLSTIFEIVYTTASCKL